jgi:NAD(P)-dependent dehydrogenase (short-subunit alcohol dehydrogenase family)
MEWKGKNAYVSGGSSGIGFAVAQELLSRGCSVVLIARDAARLANSRGRLLRFTGMAADSPPSDTAGPVRILSLDVSDHEAVIQALGNCFDIYGEPDIVVNCAGMAYPDYFEKIPYDVFRKTMDTNLGGVWNILSALVPRMIERKTGIIVSVSSIAGFLGVFGYAAYSASKFAVFGLMEVLRGELKPHGIRVHVLCPPDTDTPQLAQEDATKPPETRAVSGNGGIMQPFEVAEALVRGIERKRFVIIPGFFGNFTYLMSRLFPGLVRLIMDGDIKKARNQVPIRVSKET